MPDDLDVRRLIEEVKAHPIIWDIRYGEYKDRTTTPQQWAEIAGVLGVDAEHCKRKWKNLRDAYRAEVRRIERRIERLKESGNYDSSIDIRSKWAYFEPMSFINSSRRPRNHPQAHKSEGEASNGSNDGDDGPGFHSFCDIKMEPHHTTDEDECEDDDRLLQQFVNAATPQAVRRLSNSISMANSVEDAAKTAATSTSRGNNCKCTNRADDQVHFLETLEREEQSLIQSTRMDMTRDNSTNHVGDSDYNFLVSFLPQMKRMSELQNLQFRAKMSELLLNIMTPQSIVSVQAMRTADPLSGTQFQQPQQQQQQEQQQQLQLQPLLRDALPSIPLVQLQKLEFLPKDEQKLQSHQQIQQKREPIQRPQGLSTSDFMDAEPLESNNELVEDSLNNWS